jgi:hypothetical protein
MAGLELPDCSKCPASPELREAWGCEKPAPAAVAWIPDDEGGVTEYFTCPKQCIPPSVGDFLERLEYMEKYSHTAPHFDELGERWRAFERYFREKVTQFEKLEKERG